MSRIKDIEEKLRLKQRQQQPEAKQQATQVVAAPAILPKNQVLKSIYTGKIEEKLEKELEEIYTLKREAEKEKAERYYRGGDRYKRQKERERRDKHRRSRSKDKDRRHKNSDSEER